MQLLGRECNDIDIALDDMLDTEFAEKVNKYLLSLGKEKMKIVPILPYISFSFCLNFFPIIFLP